MKQETLQLTGANFRKDRRKLDFYPTPEAVTVALMDYLALPSNLTIWEPACGNYAMSNVIKRYGNNVIESDTIYGQNYFTTHFECDAIITNPPFNLAEQFIEKAVNEAGIVAMLLKSQYWHSLNRFSLFTKHPPSFILPLTWRPDFLEHTRKGKKGSSTMELIWTVWKRDRNVLHTIYHPLLKPKPKGQFNLFTN